MKKLVLRFTEHLVMPTIGMLVLLSLFVLLVSLPQAWEPIYDSVMKTSKLKQLHIEDAHRISQGFWNGKSYLDINKTLNLRILGPREIRHYEDVRNIIHLFIYSLSIGLLCLMSWRFILKRKIRWLNSLAILLLTGGGLTVWGLINWRHMFRTLHWWIFQDDSWILPKNCYTLHLYPYAVWQQVSSIVMGALFLTLLFLTISQWLFGRKKLS